MSEQNEFKTGWPIVAAAAVGIGLGLSPLPFYTIDVMAGPLAQEFAWSRGDIFRAIAVYTFIGLFTAPAIGMLAERFGSRRVALISIASFGLAMMALALNNGSKWLYYFLWFCLALAGAGTLPVVLTRPVNNWFDKQRGLALGVALIATGIFGALAKGLAQFMVDTYGWRMAYVALGCLPIFIALPFALLTLRDIHDTPYSESRAAKWKPLLMSIALLGGLSLVYASFQFTYPLYLENGLRLQYAMAFAFMFFVVLGLVLALFAPIKLPQSTVVGSTSNTHLPGLTLQETLRTWQFWLLAICFVPISYSIGAMIPSIVPMLTTKGFSVAEAVSLATLIGLAVFLGRLIGGYLIDKIWAPAVAFVFLCAPAIALFLFTGEVTQSGAVIAILMIGFGAGVEYDFMAYLVSKYFGMKRYSAIYGALYAFFGAGAGFGPSVMNDLADVQGWDFTLRSAAVALIIATIPLLFLGRYRQFN